MTLEEQFQLDLYESIELFKRDSHYNPTYFLKMLKEHGGVATAKGLLYTQEFQSGLTRLWEVGQLLNSMENVVCQRKYRTLFTAHEIKTAKKRLRDLEFEPQER